MFDVLEKEIKKYEKIIICRHQRPDPDAIGAQIALTQILQKTYPNKNIIPYGSDNPIEFAFIGLNQELKEEEFLNSLVIFVDNANRDRAEAPMDFIENNNIMTIKIDHHQPFDQFAKINIVDEHISSTCEYIYQIFVEQLQYQIDDKIAWCLTAGIWTDTGGFSYSNTSDKTFLTLAQLRKEKFDFEALMLMLKEHKLIDIRILGWMYQNVEVKENVGILKLSHELLQKLKFKRQNVSMLVNYIGSIKEISSWVLMVEYEHFIRVNLRSKRDIDISKIATKYNGGGHKNASGATIKKWDEADQIIYELIKITNE